MLKQTKPEETLELRVTPEKIAEIASAKGKGECPECGQVDEPAVIRAFSGEPDPGVLADFIRDWWKMRHHIIKLEKRDGQKQE